MPVTFETHAVGAVGAVPPLMEWYITLVRFVAESAFVFAVDADEAALSADVCAPLAALAALDAVLNAVVRFLSYAPLEDGEYVVLVVLSFFVSVVFCRVHMYFPLAQVGTVVAQLPPVAEEAEVER